jgi:hypothetical protein
MLELKAGAFYETTTQLVGTASWIGARSFRASGIPDPVFHEDTGLNDYSRQYITERLANLPQYLGVLGASVTTLAVQDAQEAVSRPYAKWGTVKKVFEEITNTLRRELSLTTILVIEQKQRGYFAPREPLFGTEFAEKFKTAGAYELDEAAKCLALGRPTASVFHLMRLLEVGIRATSRCLKIPDPIRPAERNWAVILKAIWNEVEQRWPTAADRMAGDGQLFEALHASLDAVKNPWRNQCMHVEGKYTDDEAEHILVAVRGFMKKLASRCDEAGLPLA